MRGSLLIVIALAAATSQRANAVHVLGTLMPEPDQMSQMNAPPIECTADAELFRAKTEIERLQDALRASQVEKMALQASQADYRVDGEQPPNWRSSPEHPVEQSPPPQSGSGAANFFEHQFIPKKAQHADHFIFKKAQHADQLLVPKKAQHADQLLVPKAQDADQFIVPKAHHHRKALATPTPTPVPTTNDITTYAQLSAAVASKISDEEIVVVADMAFPSQSPIAINTSQSVSIVGRSSAGNGEATGRVTLDGLGDSRLFLVRKFGTLYLTNLNLVNGRTAVTEIADCAFDGPELCMGGAILVLDGATLVMSHCDVRGQGRGVPAAAYGGGVFSEGTGATHSFYNVSFADLCAYEGTAFNLVNRVRIGKDSVSTFQSCRFEGNDAIFEATIYIAVYDQLTYFFDCHWENNEGFAVFNNQVESKRTMGSIIGCSFRNNTHLAPQSWTGTYSGSGVIAMASAVGMDITDCIFEKNIGMVDGNGGTVGVFSGSFCTLTNCTFIENTAFSGGALAAGTTSTMTIIGCYFRGNVAKSASGDIDINKATVTIINSTFMGSTARYAGIAFVSDGSLTVTNSLFSGAYATDYTSGFWSRSSSVLITDSIVRDTESAIMIGPFYIESDSSFHMLRTSLINNRAPASGIGIIGCIYGRASTLIIEDSELIDCSAALAASVFFGRSGGHFTFINSRIMEGTIAEGTTTYRGTVGYLDSDSSARFIGGTIMNASGVDEIAIYDDSTSDFGFQMDSVVVDDTVTVFSNGTKILLQNCEGFSSTALAKAEVATCASTADYCLRESCVDTATGIDCVCEVDGIETPFPTDCMQSAVIKVLLPSTLTLTYIINKPFNESAELLLANVRAPMCAPCPSSCAHAQAAMMTCSGVSWCLDHRRASRR